MTGRMKARQLEGAFSLHLPLSTVHSSYDKSGDLRGCSMFARMDDWGPAVGSGCMGPDRGAGRAMLQQKLFVSNQTNVWKND